MPDLLIAPMTQKDVPFVHHLCTCCFSRPWSLQALAEECEKQRSLILAAFHQQELVGLIHGNIVLDEANIHHLAVAAQMRRKSVGTRLLTKFLKLLEQRAVKTVHLEVRASNLSAQQLYQKQGFALVGRRKNFYDAPQEDALLMSYDAAPETSCSGASIFDAGTKRNDKQREDTGN